MTDKNGREIKLCDLLRSPHFYDRKYRRMHYLYHVVTQIGGTLYMTPHSRLANPKDNRGGECMLTEGLAGLAEIVACDCTDLWYERKRP